MNIYSAKCKKCGYEIEVSDGPGMIEANNYEFTESATFICPECKKAEVHTVLLKKKNLRESLTYYLNEPSHYIEPEKVLENLRDALANTTTSHYCRKCKKYMRKFTQKHIEKKLCPVCGGEIELLHIANAD